MHSVKLKNNLAMMSSTDDLRRELVNSYHDYVEGKISSRQARDRVNFINAISTTLKIDAAVASLNAPLKAVRFNADPALSEAA